MRRRKIFIVIISLFPTILWSQTNIHQELNAWLYQYETKYTTDSPEYADAVQVCARVCMDNGDIKQAFSLLGNSDNIFRLFGKGVFEGRDTIQEIFHLDLLSQLEYDCERDYHAVRYARKSYRLKQLYFGAESYITLISALDLSKLLAERFKYGESHRIHNNAFNVYVNILKKEFCSISESERLTYWNVANKYVGRTIQVAHNHPRSSNRGGEESLASAAYNAILLSKGILLNTTIGFEDYILKSGNSKAIAKLNQKKAMQTQSHSQNELDSIDYEILGELNRAGLKYNIPHLDITWKDVQNSLNKEDVAIEFYRTEEHDYGAIIIKKGWKSPKVIKLENEIKIGKHQYARMDELLKQELLQTIDGTNYYKLWNLSKAIWCDDLIQLLPVKGEGRVFFSADAYLQTAGIESFLVSHHLSPTGKIVTMNECFDLFRVSSTREICNVPNTKRTQTAALLYGGLEYDMTDEELLAEHTNFQFAKKNEEMKIFLAQNRSLLFRETENIAQLPGTKVEVEIIGGILKKIPEMNLSTLVGSHGTEETFKYISGRSPEIIHIATHGFYIPEEDQETDDSHQILPFKNSDEENIDDSMLRSGLLMSGALAAFLQRPKHNEIEDGILTSKEISLLDLRNTQMAVLSACETALGDVTIDGVSGLQRGFKQSGTRSILMSLWKVDDEATCTLMSEFYSNWIEKKMSKHDAFEVAKKKIRETPQWSSPKYWAAFILLDGLD